MTISKKQARVTKRSTTFKKYVYLDNGEIIVTETKKIVKYLKKKQPEFKPLFNHQSAFSEWSPSDKTTPREIFESNTENLFDFGGFDFGGSGTSNSNTIQPLNNTTTGFNFATPPFETPNFGISSSNLFQPTGIFNFDYPNETELPKDDYTYFGDLETTTAEKTTDKPTDKPTE